LLRDPTLTDAGYPDEQTGTSLLSQLLRERACLLIVDDVWKTEHLRAFLVGGPRCQILFTTRLEGIADEVGAAKIELAGMTDEEAITLLKEWSGPIAAEELDSATWLAREFDGLPLALELVGARVAKIRSWSAARRQWEEQRLDSLKRGRRTKEKENILKESFARSLNELAADSDRSDRFRYLQLGCLREHVAFPAQPATVLWGCEPGEALELLIDLSEQGLLVREPTGVNYRFRFHSLLREFCNRGAGRGEARRIAPSAHRRLPSTVHSRMANRSQRRLLLRTSGVSLDCHGAD